MNESYDLEKSHNLDFIEACKAGDLEKLKKATNTTLSYTGNLGLQIAKINNHNHIIDYLEKEFLSKAYNYSFDTALHRCLYYEMHYLLSLFTDNLPYIKFTEEALTAIITSKHIKTIQMCQPFDLKNQILKIDPMKHLIKAQKMGQIEYLLTELKIPVKYKDLEALFYISAFSENLPTFNFFLTNYKELEDFASTKLIDKVCEMNLLTVAKALTSHCIKYKTTNVDNDTVRYLNHHASVIEEKESLSAIINSTNTKEIFKI